MDPGRSGSKLDGDGGGERREVGGRRSPDGTFIAVELAVFPHNYLRIHLHPTQERVDARHPRPLVPWAFSRHGEVSSTVMHALDSPLPIDSSQDVMCGEIGIQSVAWCRSGVASL